MKASLKIEATNATLIPLAIVNPIKYGASFYSRHETKPPLQSTSNGKRGPRNPDRLDRFITRSGGVFFLTSGSGGKDTVVLDPENQTLADLFSELKPESVIEVSGEVATGESTANPNLDTGESNCSPNPFSSTIALDATFPLDDSADKVGEDLRLTIVILTYAGLPISKP